MRPYTQPAADALVRVALIDNCAAIRCALPRLLGDRGYDVVVHACASAAVSFVRRQRPAVIFLELHLEREDAGLSVMQALRRDPETAEIPLVLWSTDPELERKVTATGAQGIVVLSKYARLGTVLGVLREITGTAPGRTSSRTPLRAFKSSARI